MAFIIVDVNRFKHVNDTYGNWVGDQVLRATASVMAQCLGSFGRVGRLGGEEFALLASNEHRTTLVRELDSFRQRVAGTPILTNAGQVSITISAGLAKQHGDQTFEQLFSRADRALHTAKKSGRDRIVVAEGLDI